MKQSHDIRIIFDGAFDDLLTFLKYRGVKTEFIPPGLNGSQGVLEIDAEGVKLNTKEKDNDPDSL
jgi:hypothetical protein